MYDPKFTQKQMYDQYGKSRTTKKSDTAPSRPSTFDQFKRRETNRGLGSKPRTFGGGQDNNPNRDEAESRSVVAKVYERAVTRFRNFGASEPDDVIVDGKRVYQGPAFRGFQPTIPTENFGGRFGKQQYLFDSPELGIKTTRSPVPPTLPPGTVNRLGVNRDNPRLNMFGVNRRFTRTPASPELPTITPQPQIPEAISVPIEEDYIIEVGDTLSEIAEKRGTTVDVLLEMNDIADKDKIYAGDKLKVPTKKLTDTQAALRRGLGSKKDMSGTQFASLDPEYDFYQSMVPMDQRIFEPELGAEAQSVTGYDDVPQMVRGLMSKSNIVKEDFDTSDVESDRVSYESVKKVQKRLNDLGYTTLIGDLTVDGKLGRGTARQLRKFQATVGLPTTAAAGQPIDEATEKALKDNRFNNKEGKDPTATVTPLQDGLFEIIKAPIAKIESGGEAEPYAAIGGDGDAYDGKYQLGKKAKDTIKNRRVEDADGNMVDVFTAAEKVKLNHPSNRADFRNDKALQEKAFRQLTEANHRELTKNSAKYRAMDQANQLAVLGYAHNQGAEAALEWLTTAVVGTDAFGTRGDKYSKAITEIFTKDDMLG